MIDRITIDKIMDVARVVDVVSDFIELRQSGHELTAPCPLHGGTHLNHFKVIPAKNFYYCFVCGEGGGPVDFLMKYKGLSYPDAIRWLGQKYGIFIDEEQKRFNQVKHSEPKKIEKLPELETLHLPFSIVKPRLDTSEDTFCNWVRSLPWNKEQRNRVESVLLSYAVGHSYKGHTIFWQIDHEAHVHTGKMMKYLPDGHRDKTQNPDWIHATLARKRNADDSWPHPDLYNPDEQQMRPCLFGLHLVHAQNIKRWEVNIVESEKTAIIMAIAQGTSHGLWMATGGLQFLKPEVLKPLFDLKLNIVLHPDHDGDQRWRKKMTEFGYKYGEDYQVNNFYVNIAWKEGIDSEKADCADIVVRQLDEAMRNNKTCRLNNLMNKNPFIKKLVEKLDLQIEK